MSQANRLESTASNAPQVISDAIARAYWRLWIEIHLPRCTRRAASDTGNIVPLDQFRKRPSEAR